MDEIHEITKNLKNVVVPPSCRTRLAFAQTEQESGKLK